MKWSFDIASWRIVCPIAIILSSLSLLCGCEEQQQGVELLDISKKALSDSTFLYYDNYSDYPEELATLPIGLFDSSLDGFEVVEAFLTIDQFDNITGAFHPDNIPDFGGENFQFLADLANGSYVDYVGGSNTSFLKEHLMTNLFFMMGNSYYTLSVDDFKTGHKERVKAVVNLTNTADYLIGDEFENFAQQSGSGLISIGLMSSGINSLFESCADMPKVCVGILSSGDDITIREYESAINQRASQRGSSVNIKILSQRAIGLEEAIMGEYDYIAPLTTYIRSNYKGPDMVDELEFVDDLTLVKYNFDIQNNGLLTSKGENFYYSVQLNSVENYVRYHVVSMVEHHRRSGSKIPISHLLLSDYKLSSVKDLISKVLKELYNYKQEGTYLYRSTIVENVVLIDPIECAAKECYVKLRANKTLALRAVRSELLTYISVPVTSLQGASYTNDGLFTDEYRISRQAGKYEITTKIIPFSTRFVNQKQLNYLGTNFPISYSLVRNSLY